MKAVFVSLLTVAASALAAPAALIVPRDVASAVKTTDALIVKELDLGHIAKGVSKRQTLPTLPAVTDAASLVALLTTTVSTLKSKAAAVEAVLADVTAGKLSPDAGEQAATPDIEAMQFQLSAVVEALTAAAGLDVPAESVDEVLTLVVALVSLLLDNVKAIVTVLGLRPQLIVLLNSVFALLAKVLLLVIGLVAALLPGLVAALSPLLAGLGNGVLVPILTPVVALVASLAAGL